MARTGEKATLGLCPSPRKRDWVPLDSADARSQAPALRLRVRSADRPSRRKKTKRQLLAFDILCDALILTEVQ